MYCSYGCKYRARRGAPIRDSPHVALAAISSYRRVSEYLALPAAERWARRGELSQAELKMAEKMLNQMHGLRMV